MVAVAAVVAAVQVEPERLTAKIPGEVNRILIEQNNFA